jgi:SagB-type dehydrogenase family enzyme
MAAENTSTPGRPSDTSLIREPHPRSRPEAWQPFELPFLRREFLPLPKNPPAKSFCEVLEGRRSAVHGRLTKELLGDLLWYATGVRGWEEAGRASIPISWRPAPSGGGLHPIEIIAIPDQPGGSVLHYDAMNHSYGYWEGPWDGLIRENYEKVGQAIGTPFGWTLFFVADVSKTGAAYENPLSIVLRDSGCLIATLCFCAEWLGLSSCPIGSLRQELVDVLGFPAARYAAVGAVQISKRV